jgi:hypothetical protein
MLRSLLRAAQPGARPGLRILRHAFSGSAEMGHGGGKFELFVEPAHHSHEHGGHGENRGFGSGSARPTNLSGHEFADKEKALESLWIMRQEKEKLAKLALSFEREELEKKVRVQPAGLLRFSATAVALHDAWRNA